MPVDQRAGFSRFQIYDEILGGDTNGFKEAYRRLVKKVWDKATSYLLDPSSGFHRLDDSSHRHHIGCCSRINILRLELL